MIGRGTIEAEEKRSYSTLFVFVIGLLIACAIWAVWQDSFSRQRWKKFKTDFYRTAIVKYQKDLADDAKRLDSDKKYVALKSELSKIEQRGDSPEVASKLSGLEKHLDAAKVHVTETDLNLRFVKGHIEQAWYYLEQHEHEGKRVDEDHKKLAALVEERKAAAQAYADAVKDRDDTKAAIDKLHGRRGELKEQIAPYLKNRTLLLQKLDGVSIDIFGKREPRIPMLTQVVLPSFERNNFEEWVDRVDRCTNCHVAINKAGFEDRKNPEKTHPDRTYYLGNHEKFGCTACHGGQGPSVNSVAQAHGLVHYWEDPLLDVKDKVQAKCLTCHESAIGLKGAEVAAHGEQLFRDMGCHNCHLAKGFEHLGKAGPTLRRIAAKVSPEWLVSWVNHPHEFRPRTRMPDFLFDRNEAVDIAAYLLASSLDDSRSWLKEHPGPRGVDPADAALVAQGKALTHSLGCLGCHGFEPDAFASQVAIGKDTAPNLARIAEKTGGRWIYNWLRNPRGYSEIARMPNLRLSNAEAGAITSYLLTLKASPPLPVDSQLRHTLTQQATIARGEKLVRKYGCHGCHVINGMEHESRVGVELSAFGDKHPEELAFGNRLDLPKTWDAWTINKILTPRTYATERLASQMPQFGFDKKDARALVVFLASRTDKVIRDHYTDFDDPRAAKIRAGRAVIARYNCHGCHSFDGHEGSIRRFYEDDIENAPPILVGEGSKLQPDWFVDFLKRPVRLRPWLKVRMPTFGLADEEVGKIVDYFEAAEGYDLGRVIVESGAPEAPAKRGVHKTDVLGGYSECASCHPQGRGKVPSNEYSVSRKALTPSEVRAWTAEHAEGEASGAGTQAADRELADGAAVREFLSKEAADGL